MVRRLADGWRRLPPPHRRWILLKALLGGAAINVATSAIIAWLGVLGQGSVSLWGVPLAQTSMIWNLIGTLFLLPLLTYVLTAAAIRRDVRLGALAPLRRCPPPRRAAPPLAGLGRGAWFGVLALAVLGPPLVLALLLAAPGELSRAQFVICQTAFALLLGLLLTPALALCGMAHPSHGAVA